MKNADTKSLFVKRRLLNVGPFLEWVKKNDFSDFCVQSVFHVTVVFSRKSVNWKLFVPDTHIITVHGGKTVEIFDKGAVVLTIEHPFLKERNEYFLKNGCSFDHPYRSHVTLTFNGNRDVSNIMPYNGTLFFGPEEFQEIKV